MSRGGEEYALAHGDYTAAVTQVGAGLRSLRYAGRDLVLGYPAGDVRPLYRGSVLAPWPNRITDGRYSFAGRSFQLPLTEPERGTALHGLVCWARFDPVEVTGASAVLRHRLVPSTGYPFELEITVSYGLGDDGLTSTVGVRNVGDEPAPWGTAVHPYVTAGDGRVDDWTLQLPAAEVLEVTPDRLLPVGVRPVDGTGYDFRESRRIGVTALDHAYTSLAPAADGMVTVRLTGPDGDGVQCRWDAASQPWVQVHTADLPDPENTRRGLALEPMTCPPDAFNSGTDLVVLRPGAEHTVASTLAAVTAG